MTTTSKINLTVKEMEDVFTEWEKQSRKAPGKFMSDAHIAKTSSRELGKQLTTEFIFRLAKLRSKKTRKVKGK